MNKNLMLFAALCAAVVISITCSGYLISGREFLSVRPHVETSVSEQGVPQAGNYTELRAQVIALVENAQTDGSIHLKDYPSDVESDLARACHEVMTETPIGAYAVDMMSIDHTRVLNYYDVKVSVSYKRPREEILAVESADSAEQFYQVMKDAIEKRRETFAVLCNYYAEQIINVADTMASLRFDEPGAAYGVEDVTVQFFPKSGLHRMLLVEFEFYETAEESALKRDAAQAEVDRLYAATDGLSGSERIRELCRMLSRGVEVAPVNERGDANTAYGALINKRASDRGLAMAVKQAVTRAGGYAVVVDGELDGEQHFWNMVFAESGWKHVDLSRGVMLREDRQMTGYSWDDLKYPTDISYVRNK